MHIAVDTHTFGCLKAAFLLLPLSLLSSTALARHPWTPRRMPPKTSKDSARCARVSAANAYAQPTESAAQRTRCTPHAQHTRPHPASRISHPALVPSTEDVTNLLAEKDAIIAAQAKEIEELTKQLSNVKVKAGDKIVGLYGNKDGTIVRAVYQGADKGTYTKNPGGGKKYLKTTDADNDRRRHKGK